MKERGCKESWPSLWLRVAVALVIFECALCKWIGHSEGVIVKFLTGFH